MSIHTELHVLPKMTQNVSIDVVRRDRDGPIIGMRVHWIDANLQEGKFEIGDFPASDFEHYFNHKNESRPKQKTRAIRRKKK